MRYAHPGSEGAIVSFKARYGNYIGGEFVPPVKGQYFTNTSPVNGQPIAEFPRSTAEDIDKALDAAHAAADAWGRTSVQERSNILLKIADRIEQNLELLAVTETWDNGKAVRETLNAGEALATSKRIAKIAFTGSTPVGSHILKCAAENIIPSTVELGGKSPNIYFEDIMQAEPAFIEKAAEGLVLAFFNQGEVCTCPSRALVQESIYPAFMEEVLKKVRAIKRGDPLDTETMVGAQASQQQYEKILSYLDIAQQEGAELLAGGSVEKLEGNLASGYYIQPTLLKGHNGMRVFQEEIFGPVVGVTTFKDEAEALAIANDTEYGLGAGLWTRDINRAYRMGRGIKAGRVWTNCYHLYPAHAAFGGYKKSGVGRETHKMMLDHYQQTKNLLVSYDINPLGFF
ncbi:aldehyde dehydrogenase family protein [Pseudomonas aeruginosa]|uniref:aldehyde dehydrogenase family protein n=1 Tax=Pseudomonas aeruginosa TaxID=287 RepID=UPI0010689F04|nr:aldehyde dehydrogenase family protein [Pseudomonas aeruginosa]TEG39121.1 aldehyde dehydrogenase family protein [Pseudomonas aeruginosa]